MLLPDMFDEKVALMGQEAQASESRPADQGRLIALNLGQMVTLFTTGPEGHATMPPVGIVLDDTNGAGRRVKAVTAGGMQHYQSAHIVLHATGNSDLKQPQLTDKLRGSDGADETRTRVLPNLISNTTRRSSWTLGITTSAQALLSPPGLPRTVSKTPPTTSVADSPPEDVERRPIEGGGNSENGVEEEDESDTEVGWFGGVTRWVSKFWSTKRVETRAHE